MAKRYEKGSKIDPELRGTVDFDFFESEDFDKTAKDESGAGDQTKQKDEDYYYDDDDSFESDDGTESGKDSKVEKKVEKEQTKNTNTVKAKEESKKVKRSPSPSPERSDSPTPRAAKTKSKPPRNRPDSDVSSSESDITEVSPLGSRDSSPKHSAREQNKSKKNKKEKVKIVEEQDGDLNMDVLMETIMKMEKERAQHQKKNVMFIPPRDPADRRDSTDKNYSFEKQKLEDIERENHRLLHKILTQHQRKNRPQQGLSSQYAIPPCRRQFHSALNRQKEQRRIEEENMKILHRLQKVKPTKEVSRHELLSDTKKQAMYGIPVHSLKQRRHSDSSFRTFDETYEEGEWEGETQVNRLEEPETNNSKTSLRSKKKSPTTKRPGSDKFWSGFFQSKVMDHIA